MYVYVPKRRPLSRLHAGIIVTYPWPLTAPMVQQRLSPFWLKILALRECEEKQPAISRVARYPVGPCMARGGSGQQRGPPSAERQAADWDHYLCISLDWWFRRWLGLAPARPPHWRPPLSPVELQHWAWFEHHLEEWEWEEPVTQDGAPPQ